jgi:hypothetical protein
MGMKTKISDNEAVAIHHSKDEEFLMIKWKKDCDNILDEKYSGEIDNLKQIISERAPKKIMVDMASCSYNLTPDTGPWYENKLFAWYNDLTYVKVALILPGNLWSHSFFEVVSAYDNTDFKTEIQFFKDADKAADWLGIKETNR